MSKKNQLLTRPPFSNAKANKTNRDEKMPDLVGGHLGDENQLKFEKSPRPWQNQIRGIPLGLSIMNTFASLCPDMEALEPPLVWRISDYLLSEGEFVELPVSLTEEIKRSRSTFIFRSGDLRHIKFYPGRNEAPDYRKTISGPKRSWIITLNRNVMTFYRKWTLMKLLLMFPFIRSIHCLGLKGI